MGRDRRPAAGWFLAFAAALFVALGWTLPSPAAAQQAIGEQIRESQDRLDDIRRERQQLGREYEQLRGQVHTATEEVRNIERRIGASTGVLAELDLQIAAYAEQVQETTQDLLRTHDDLVLRRTELRERLRDIYQRGRLHAFQVLLEARSFGDLLSRYKYLQLVARYDRTLVSEVRRLEERLEDQRARLAREYARLRTLRGEKRQEIDDLERLERERERRLQSAQRRASQTQSRLSALDAEERRLADLLVELERARREAERLAGTTSTSTLRTSDLGQLNWPVQGEIVYRFGERRPDVDETWKGIGIGAPRGTPVASVEGGEVAWAGSRHLLGQTVVIDHGGGYWSSYLYLQDLRVRMGDRVASGQILGMVGGEEGAPGGNHIEFQIYEPDREGLPRQVDPVRWLRGRS